MLHPDTHIEYFNSEIGHGIIANKLIPKGTVIWCLDKLDRFLSEEEMQALGSLLYDAVFHFSYRNKEGKYVVPWDAARFMNHSYHPNCLITPYNFEIVTRDIFPGEQLTCDYGTLNIVEPVGYSGGPAHRIRVAPDDLLHYYAEWDQLIQEALQYFDIVPQPLISLMPQEVIQTIHDFLAGNGKLESIASLYYDSASQNLSF